MAGGGPRLDRPARASNDLTVGERAVGLELRLVTGVEPRRLADIERTRGAMGSFGENDGAGRGLEPRHRGGMIAMGVGDENVGDGFPANGLEKRGDMRGIERPGIDDGDLSAADDIGDGPLEREWPGI